MVENEMDMSGRFRVVLKLVGGITAVGSILFAQSKKAEDLAAGKVLVMERKTGDPVFGESVILLIHYRADGVVGLMLNLDYAHNEGPERWSTRLMPLLVE
jgi:hypothetical protein